MTAEKLLKAMREVQEADPEFARQRQRLWDEAHGREPAPLTFPDHPIYPPPLDVATVMALDLRPQTTPGGLRVYVHRPRVVKRSLRERFFTRPWRPWVATKMAPSIIGPDDCYRVGDQLHVGERAFDVLKKETAR